MSGVWSGGHSSAVLCAAVSGPSQHMVATGAEGGDLTLWNQDGSPLSTLRLSADDVTGLAFCPAGGPVLYACHGRALSVLDCRSPGAALAELRDVAEEEINGLSVNEGGRTLAAADDSGAVTLIDLQLHTTSRTLRAHHNICSSVTFRPRRPQSLVSAGLDMQVSLWNLPKPRPLWSCSLQDTQEEPAAQMCNPPLAHCVCVSSCGTVLACAAEDGGVHLLRVSEDGRLRQRETLRAHSQGASQAHFLSFLSHPYWLASGGNDGLVALWDLSREPLVASGRKPKGHKKRARAKTSDRPEEEELRPAQCFQHGEKVNWLCPAVLEGKPSLLVTDQTSCPSVYSLDQL